MEIFCARITFFAVSGKKAPAFTVASLATIITSRPQIRPRPGDGARGRCAAPLFVHFVRRVNPQLKKRSARIDQLGDAFPRRQAALLVLRLDGFGAAAQLNRGFLILDFGEQVHHAAGILLEVRRVSLIMVSTTELVKGRSFRNFRAPSAAKVKRQYKLISSGCASRLQGGADNAAQRWKPPVAGKFC